MPRWHDSIQEDTSRNSSKSVKQPKPVGQITDPLQCPLEQPTRTQPNYQTTDPIILPTDFSPGTAYISFLQENGHADRDPADCSQVSKGSATDQKAVYPHRPDLQCRLPARGTDRDWLRKPLLTIALKMIMWYLEALKGFVLTLEGAGVAYVGLASSSVESRVEDHDGDCEGYA